MPSLLFYPLTALVLYPESGQSLHLARFMAGGAGQHEVAILNKDVKSLLRSTNVAGTLQDKHYL